MLTASTALLVEGVAAVKNGTSNVILAGEKRMNTALYNLSRDDNESCYAPGWDDYEVYRRAVAVNGVWQGPKPDLFDPSAPPDPQGSFGAAPANVVYFVFCDGSVRAISYSVDGSVFRFACSRNAAPAANPLTLFSFFR